ncbi:nucleoside-diphosphate kinase [Elusimicrobium posterum]|uniref:nucleoside-diphosphate kinase n=1 Tax=Elusimicrobium posterum TaxID=3116653 RepID=UPI003C755CBA
MKTLILIKPDAIQKRLTGIILDRIESMGFQMCAAKVAVVTDELARKHYSNLEGNPVLDGVVKFMRGDYNGIDNHRVYAFVYKGDDIIQKIRALIGKTDPFQADPHTIRGQFGLNIRGVMENCIHASGSPEEAEREIALWFKPEEIVE